MKSDISHILLFSENLKDIYFLDPLKADESDLVDFAILMKCNHVILSHGTFGLWAAILSSKVNEHIIPMSVKNDMGQNEVLEEANSVISSGFENFIFMNDDI